MFPVLTLFPVQRLGLLISFPQRHQEVVLFVQYQYELVYLNIRDVFQSILLNVLIAAQIVPLWASGSHFWLLPRPFNNPTQL